MSRLRFRVVAVSDNTNSFGLRGIVTISEDGRGWEAAKSISPSHKQYQPGDEFTLPVNGSGVPNWEAGGFEIPRELTPQPSAALVRECFGKVPAQSA